MRSKHPSDEAFEAWVDGADQLRTHSVQAAFREGWAKGEERAALACPHAATVERLRSALEAINTIRDRVIRTQRVGWASVVYPLVAVLDEAGFVSTVTNEELAQVPVGNRLDGAVMTD